MTPPVDLMPRTPSIRFELPPTSDPATQAWDSMRAFVAPSILLSIARRSSRGLTQGLFPTTGHGSLSAGSRTSTSIPSSCNMMAAAVYEDAIRWPLGLDPENCKVVDIRQQIRRRYGDQRSSWKRYACCQDINTTEYLPVSTN